MKKYLFIAFILVSACGRIQPSADPQIILQEFQSGAIESGVELLHPIEAVEFIFTEDVPCGEAGCWATSQYTKIYIDKSRWEQSSAETQEVLIVHELAHVLLGASHEWGGVMETPLISGMQYAGNKGALWNELWQDWYDANGKIRRRFPL